MQAKPKASAIMSRMVDIAAYRRAQHQRVQRAQHDTIFLSITYVRIPCLCFDIIGAGVQWTKEQQQTLSKCSSLSRSPGIDGLGVTKNLHCAAFLESSNTAAYCYLSRNFSWFAYLFCKAQWKRELCAATRRRSQALSSLQYRHYSKCSEH
jgi:hypothetical protein